MLYFQETTSTRSQEAKQKVAELRMGRFRWNWREWTELGMGKSVGQSKLDGLVTQGVSQDYYFEHVRRRDAGNISNMMLKVKLFIRRKRGKQQMRFMNVVRADIRAVVVT